MDSVSKLIVLDIDNTVFNWVEYYVSCMRPMIETVAGLIGANPEQLYRESQAVFAKEGSIEYPFLIQELPSVIAFYGRDIQRMLEEAVEQGRLAFNKAAQDALVPYPDVIPTLERIRARHPKIPIVALTDAPRYVAMWKLNKLRLLPLFSAVYGLPDPTIPIDGPSQSVKVAREILIKHLQKSNFDFAGRIRILPDDYEKPGTKGLKTVLMDFDMETHLSDVLWVGDNLRKDVGLGRSLGVHTCWARYGTQIRDEAKQLLMRFSPMQNIAKNVALDPANDESPKPDRVMDSFSDLETAVDQLLNS